MRVEDERNGRTGVDIRPRYMVWENVPGAFSSNKAEDFRIVLEELAKVKDKDAVISLPPSGKWTSCGCIVGDGWSIAWRVLDAQFWGVPQRRRRIALVADFGGQSAPEILFVRKSLSGHTDESESKRKATPSDASTGIGTDDREGETPYTLKIRSGVSVDSYGKAAGKGALIPKNLSATLGVSQDQYLFQSVGADQYNAVILGDTVSTLGVNCGMSHGRQCILEPQGVICFEPGIASREGGHIYEGVSGTLRANAGDNQMATAYSVENHPNDSRVGINEDGIVQALTGRMGTGGGNVPMVLALDRASYNQGKNAQYDFEVSDKGINSPLVAKGPGAVCYSTNHGTFHTQVEEGICATLQASDYKDPPTVCFAVDCRNASEDTVNGALQSNSAHSLNGNNVVRTRYIVRRLTPLECERLQGYPDGWTDIGEWTDSNGKKRQTSDAARYKALGNSIAIPPWKWVLKRLCACYERDATMASLFDGIGGFPYLWEQLNGKGTCLWASEIEEFPIAVTKVRFT